MPVAPLYCYYWSHIILAEADTTGIAADGLDAVATHLRGIYIPNKVVFYAVHRGDFITRIPHHFGDSERMGLDSEGKMQGEELRKLFSQKSFGPVYHAVTRPSRITATLLSQNRQQPLVGLEDWDVINEPREEFLQRIDRILSAIEELGRLDAPPVLVVGRGMLAHIAARYGNGTDLEKVRQGGVIEIRYHQKTNRLIAKAIHRPVEEASCRPAHLGS